MVGEMKKYTVCVDFDGVIHSYTTPWVAPEVIPDPPVPGAIEWLHEMSAGFRVVIHTTRARTAEGCLAIYKWLAENGYEGDGVEASYEKVPALIYIDDRAWRFTGSNFPSKEEIHAARPWNKRKNTEERGGEAIY